MACMSVTRRQFLAQASAAALASGMSGMAAASVTETLRSAGVTRNLLVGCATQDHHLTDAPDYVELLKAQASILVTENVMKFGPLRPTPTTFFFDDADRVVNFAKANEMKMRGHNFVWHKNLGKWFDGYATSANAEQILVDHIETVAGRYAGQLHSWDVVNEAVLVEDGLPDGLRKSPWLTLMGPGYLDVAYRTARRADPKAMLVYNDYGIEGENEAAQKKREAVLALLRGMQDRKVPIDAMGVQSHLSAGPNHTYGEGLMKLLDQVHAMGLKVLVTEMDVNDRDLPPDIPARDAAVADVYGKYLGMVTPHPAVCAVVTWGITDRWTWLNSEASRKDGQHERPLPFDEALTPKPAFTAMVGALRRV